MVAGVPPDATNGFFSGYLGARPESPLTKSRMGLEAGRRPQIVLESGRLYNIQRRSSLPATELGVFGRTSRGSVRQIRPYLRRFERAPWAGAEPRGGRVPQGEALLTASVGRGIAWLHFLRSQG